MGASKSDNLRDQHFGAPRQNSRGSRRNPSPINTSASIMEFRVFCNRLFSIVMRPAENSGACHLRDRALLSLEQACAVECDPARPNACLYS